MQIITLPLQFANDPSGSYVILDVLTIYICEKLK